MRPSVGRRLGCGRTAPAGGADVGHRISLDARGARGCQRAADGWRATGRMSDDLAQAGVDDPGQGGDLPPLPGPVGGAVAADDQGQPGRRERRPHDVVGSGHARAATRADDAAARHEGRQPRPRTAPAPPRPARCRRRAATTADHSAPTARRACSTTARTSSSRSRGAHEDRGRLEGVEPRVVEAARPPAAPPRRRRRPPAGSPARAGRRATRSGRSTTSSSIARPAPRSRISMPTISPRTAPIRLATWPSAPGRSGSHRRTTKVSMPEEPTEGV